MLSELVNKYYNSTPIDIGDEYEWALAYFGDKSELLDMITPGRGYFDMVRVHGGYARPALIDDLVNYNRMPTRMARKFFRAMKRYYGGTLEVGDNNLIAGLDDFVEWKRGFKAAINAAKELDQFCVPWCQWFAWNVLVIYRTLSQFQAR